jgi:hypothetical protein
LKHDTVTIPNKEQLVRHIVDLHRQALVVLDDLAILLLLLQRFVHCLAQLYDTKEINFDLSNIRPKKKQNAPFLLSCFFFLPGHLQLPFRHICGWDVRDVW